MGLVLGAAGVVGVFLILVMVAQWLQPRAPELDAGGGEIAAAIPGGGDQPLRVPAEAQPEPAPAAEVPPAGRGRLMPSDSVRAAESGPVEPLPAGLPEGGSVRWISTWANVREGRSRESRVLQVLPPGRQVVVTNRSAGWWELYVDGRFVGYIAGSLLLKEPPDTLVRPR